jgi:hypothetical protein
MPLTRKLGWIYPAETQRDWMDIWDTLMNQQDTDVYSAIEDPNLYLRGGGEIYLDTALDILYWDAPMEILSCLTGGVVAISAGSLVGFTDGKIAYVQVSRPITGNVVLTLQVADYIGSDRNKIFVAMRRGDVVYMRNNVNRVAMAEIDKWAAKKVTTLSVSPAGDWKTGSIRTGVSKGSIWRLQVKALGNTVDSSIWFYSDFAMSNVLYESLNKDCYTTPFYDGEFWYMETTSGLLYYKVKNDGANASIYEIEMSGIGMV